MIKVLLFDNNFNCFSSLSPENVTVELLENVKSLNGSFLHVPHEMVSLISGKEEKQALDSILKDIEKL
jgi:hypothetical protein